MWEKRALCLSASNGAFKEWPCPSFSCLWPSGHKIAKELSYLGMQEELRVVILPFDSVNGVCLQKNSPHNLFKSKRPTHGQKMTSLAPFGSPFKPMKRAKKTRNVAQLTMTSWINMFLFSSSSIEQPNWTILHQQNVLTLSKTLHK